MAKHPPEENPLTEIVEGFTFKSSKGEEDIPCKVNTNKIETKMFIVKNDFRRAITENCLLTDILC